MKNNIALCFFTSTKGHYDIRSRFKETVVNINLQVPIRDFCCAVAHIKITPGEQDIADDMQKTLESYGFQVEKTTADWRHADQSHQSEYLKDIKRIFNLKEVQACEYALFQEDDITIHPRKHDLRYYLYKSTSILKNNTDVISVRIPRASNERERINKLKQKHGIFSKTADSDEKELYFFASDFSNNPHLIRPRDMRNALILMERHPQSFMQHSEMGLGPAIKYFSYSDMPIAIFNPDQIVGRHIGVIDEQREDPNKEYYSD